MSMIRFYFDYVDPASRLMEERVRTVADELGLRVELVPFEVRGPGGPAIAPDDPSWSSWWDAMEGPLREIGVSPVRPERVPSSRKAHELRLHAIEAGMDAEMHDHLWTDVLEKGVDIARIDLLVRSAEQVGLDPSEARAVLDVDRWSAEMDRLRRSAEKAGVQGVPSIMMGSDLMEGVHAVDAIREFVSGFEPPED